MVVITNSLASTDGVPVHSKYQRYRKPLFQAGVEVYEIKPTAAARSADSGRAACADRADHSGSVDSHARTFDFDRRIGFVGSYNLDPRSNKLNTEVGVVFDCPKMVRPLPETLERISHRTAYRVELVGNRLGWVTREGGKELRFDSVPEARLWKCVMVRMLSWLPIDGLL